MGKFISLFAGVGGFDLGMELAGHECVAQVEWDKNAAGVLKRRWPDVPLFCDVSRVSGEDLPDCDFLTYGFPCQDLSVAGKREGLSGERSGLFFEATRLIRELRARGSGIRFALAENVAGLFSADDGRAFARCIGELLESGASEIGWRMFDSQYFGVPQRRKRVFIVADFGGRSCDEIFAITESLPGYPAPSRESGKGIAGDVEAGIGKGSGSIGFYASLGTQGGGVERNIAPTSKAGGLTAVCQGGDLGGGSETLLTQGADKDNFSAIKEEQAEILCRASDQANAETLIDQAPTLNCNKGSVPIAAQFADVYNGELTGEVAPTVTSATGISNASGPKAISWNGDVTPKASEDVSVTLRSQQGGEGVGVAHEVDPIPLDMRQCTRNPEKKDEMNRQSTGTGDPGEPSYTLTNGATPGVAFQKSELRLKDKIELNEVSPTLNAETKQGDTEVNVVKENLTVRRLTPKECERLQGFPDEWTIERMELELVDNEWKPTGKVIKQTDGPRYKQMGNAVTVNVAYWLGKRMRKVIDE